jgi:gamma-glutamyltranspeptidase/glutathione hydrolase
MSICPEFASAAVAAPHRLAAQTGQTLLAMGANAIETMVGMAATVAVAYPHMNALGGDGVWLIREPGGRVRALEACGFAGADATIRRYFDLGHERKIPERGPLAALVTPGAVDGWRCALELSAALGGKTPLADLLSDAVRLAREGCPVSASEARTKPHLFDALKEAPGFADAYLVDGAPAPEGHLRTSERLAGTLEQLAHAGLRDFYRGDAGREIAADLARIGAPIARTDLEKTEARWRAPLSLRLADATVFNAPPPTQGLASLMILGLFERLGVARADSFEWTHGLVEATRRAFRVRAQTCVDPMRAPDDFMRWLEADTLEREAAAISMTRAAPFALTQGPGDTVWMGAIDASGLAVSYIQSTYWEYGSGCVLPATGVLMSNRGCAFSLDEDSPRALAPGLRPFHTLNPPLAAFDDGRVVAYGSMGGDGQPQFQAQILSRLRFGADPLQAVEAPRFLLGHTWGQDIWGEASDSLKLEARFDPSLVARLKRAGHEIEEKDASFADLFGHAGMVLRHAKGRLQAAHDPRADGGALGL